MAETLTAKQAAARLGVKVETIYAYVSRGLLTSEPGESGRSSRFRLEELENFARKPRRMRHAAGIEVAIDTEITGIKDHVLLYRGRSAVLLSREASFESVAEWLWQSRWIEHPRWPTVTDRSPLDSIFDSAGDSAGNSPFNAGLDRAQAGSSDADNSSGSAADYLRIRLAQLAAEDPLRYDLSASGVAASARRLIVNLAAGLPGAIGSASRRDRSDAQIGIAHALASRLSRSDGDDEADTEIDKRAAVLNAAMVLLADHELASSTLAVRIAASVRADPYAAVLAGIGTASGKLHGALGSEALEMLRRIDLPRGAPERIGQFLRLREKLPGFGHGLYPDGDPRASELLRVLADRYAESPRWKIVQAVLDLTESRLGIYPNIDFALAAFCDLAHLSDDAPEVVFSTARIAGWIAHASEEYRAEPLRFRARANYIGPEPNDD